MRTTLIILGCIAAIPVTAVVAFVVYLATTKTNPFQ